MDKPFFTADDFSLTRYTTVQEIIDQANAKLASALGPKVYGTMVFEDMLWSSKHTKEDTHTAYLFNIQPTECQHKNFSISEPHLAGAKTCNDCGMYYNPNMGGWKKVCKHEPIQKTVMQLLNQEWICKYCGIELIAKWEAKNV